MTLIVLLLLIIHGSNGLIGYDCASRNMGITTLSLREIAECDIPKENITKVTGPIQLLQLNDYDSAQVVQCKVVIQRNIFHCGMFSHNSAVFNGIAEYVWDIDKYTCLRMHRTGILKIGHNHVISGLKGNSTIAHNVILAGSIANDGECSGAGYSDPYGSWDNVVVQGLVKITLTDHYASVNLNSNKIHFDTNTVCDFQIGTCIDRERGNSYWEVTPKDTCQLDRYGLLYHGPASVMVDTTLPHRPFVYTVTSNDITFALTATGSTRVCGHILVKTEHPKLFVYIVNDGFAVKPKESLVTNFDMFTYVNSKFVYVEKHIRKQITSLYRDLILQRCNLERQTLMNSLSLAAHSPDEFAYNLMKSPGYMAVVAGEVVHLLKCIPVEVMIEESDQCYEELRVTRKNETFFLTPKTRILKMKGTEVTCNRLFPSQFHLGGSWYKLLPKVTEAKEPTIIKPNSKGSWEYRNPGELATSGIYSETELRKLNERILFPVENAAVLNDLVREMRGRVSNSSDGAIINLINEVVVEKIMQNSWQKLWSKFMTFGTASAGVIAILVILHVMKLIVDIIIRGYTLHTVYGWSIKLLGAVFSSIAHLLLYLGQKNNEGDEKTSTYVSADSTPKPPPRKKRLTQRQNCLEKSDISEEGLTEVKVPVEDDEAKADLTSNQQQVKKQTFFTLV